MLRFLQFKEGHLWEQGVLHSERYDCLESPDGFMDAPLFEPLFTKRVNLLDRFKGFLLNDKLGFDYFSTSELLYPKMRVRLRIIRARPHFFIISDSPNVSFEIIDCSPYNRRIALKDDYHEERMDKLAYTPMEYKFLETLAKTFIMTARQSEFLQKKLTMLQLVETPLQWIQTLHSLDRTLEVRPGICCSISDHLEYSDEFNQSLI